MGRKYRGRQGWPFFRSFEPGYAPWFLSPGEARFLTQALEQTVDVARRLETNPHLLDAADDETYLVRVTERNGRLVWRDEHMYGRLAALKDIMGVELFYEPILPAMEEVKDQLLAYLQR